MTGLTFQSQFQECRLQCFSGFGLAMPDCRGARGAWAAAVLPPPLLCLPPQMSSCPQRFSAICLTVSQAIIFAFHHGPLRGPADNLRHSQEGACLICHPCQEPVSSEPWSPGLGARGWHALQEAAPRDRERRGCEGRVSARMSLDL